MRVLVVEDSRAMRFHLTTLLTNLGAECVEADDGAVAVELVENDGPFDLALVDYNMPNLDGAGFLNAVQSSDKAEHMKKLMVTSMTDPQIVEMALAKGADEYLMKPFTRAALIEKLRLLDFELPTA